MSPADALSFLRSWARHPMRVGAIAPSGIALARLITREVDPRHAPVLELGAGTGVFTQALLERGLAASDLTLVESMPSFARLLAERYPQARVLRMDAARLAGAPLYPEASVGAAVSGLPLLSLSPRSVYAILAGAFRWLRPGACLYQFTYGLRCPVPPAILHRLGLRAVRVGRALRNLPPASVYRLSRRPVRAGEVRRAGSMPS